jgi:hypothetical protein
MEMSQGNSLCSYLKQLKCHPFLFKIIEQEGGTDPAWGIRTSGRRRMWGKVV